MKLLWDEIGRYSAIGSMGGPGDVTFARVYDRLRCEELALCTTKRPKGLGAESAMEFARLSRIDHPALTRVRDFGLTDEAVFYSRELGLPSTLKDVASDSIEESWIYSFLMGAAEGLAALHESGLVHGLVLPEHLHVATGDEAFSAVRVADAGLRRLLSPAALRARERYDSPEVRAGAETTPASDIYQLGTTILELFGRSGRVPLAAKGEPPFKPATARERNIDRELLDLLNGVVAPDPRKRYANGQALRRAVQGTDWAMPERSADVRSLITPQLVGRESELGRFAAILERAQVGDVHAVEFLGPIGMGRSRILRESGVKAEQAGWVVIPIAPEDRTATIVAAAAKGKGKLLFLVDNADRNDPDLIAALRILVSDAAKRPLLVVSAGEKAVGWAGAEAIVLRRFDSRDLQRFIEPLLLRALNPEDMLREVERSAAGNPLWVELILASWLESGRLRLVHGRPFLDERVDAPVPKTVAETVSFIVRGLSPGERDLVEAMAVWGAPLSADVAGRVFSIVAVVPGAKVEAEVPEALVGTEGGRYRFIGETVGRVILDSMAPARKQHWSAAFLSVLAGDELQDGQRALLLLGAGRTAEGIRALVAEAREAEERNAYSTAFRHFRDALAHYPEEPVPGVDRVQLALDGARLAILVGELHWAREVLESVDPMDPVDPAREFEHIFLQANVLRELRHAGEATKRYAEARALIDRNPSLRERLVEVELGEASIDAQRGEGERALRGVEAIVKRLEPMGASRELGLALQRLALLHAHVGHTRASAVIELRCARVARRLGDHQLAARAYVNLGSLYRLLHLPRRALMAVDSAQAELVHSPNDKIAATGLVNRAETLIEMGRTDEGEAALLRAKALRQRSGERGRLPVILMDLGALCRHSGRLAASAAYLREAISLAEEFEHPIAHVAQSNLGEIFLHQGEYEEAGRLLRLGLVDGRPHHRGITLINLGRLHREQMRLREALQVLDEAEMLLEDSAPHYRPLAVIERGRVLLDAGDVDGATLQLLQVESEVGETGEQQAEYGLLAGLITATRGEAPQPAFDAAIDAVRTSKDPTLRAEVLIAVLERAIPLAAIDRDWIASHFQLLEAAAAMTDARPVAIGLRLIRGAFAERFPSSPAPGAQILANHLQRNLERGGSGLESALGELMQELPGATGAAVFVVGIDADGKPLVSSIPRSESPAGYSRDGRVRPYRLAVREFDRKVFREALAAASGNVHEAARQLRLPTSTFRYRAMKLGLLKPTQRDS